MTRKYSIPLTTELSENSLFTGVYASGDERRYMRALCMKQMQDSANPGVLKNTTLQDVVDFFDHFAGPHTNSILLSIPGVMYEDDDSLIPDGDADQEYTAYILLTDAIGGLAQDPKTIQIRAPKLNGADEFGLWLETVGGMSRFDILTDAPTGMQKHLGFNFKPERKARASS